METCDVEQRVLPATLSGFESQSQHGSLTAETPFGMAWISALRLAHFMKASVAHILMLCQAS